jgi:hypothetical protein
LVETAIHTKVELGVGLLVTVGVGVDVLLKVGDGDMVGVSLFVKYPEVGVSDG